MEQAIVERIRATAVRRARIERASDDVRLSLTFSIRIGSGTSFCGVAAWR
jgi:hypothetical protein